MLTSVVQQFDVYLFGKDTKGNFLFCNDKFAEAAGLDSAEQIVGKSDYDLVWKHQAHMFKAGDDRVLRGESFRNIQEIMYQSKKKSDILVCKNQLLNTSNEIIGVIGSFIDITGQCLQKKSGHYDAISGRFHLGEAFGDASLSAQQFQVFKQILLGHSAQQIAQCLNLSKRTVEAYIETIKYKLQCNSKGEIIAVAIFSGLMHVVDGQL